MSTHLLQAARLTGQALLLRRHALRLLARLLLTWIQSSKFA